MSCKEIGNLLLTNNINRVYYFLQIILFLLYYKVIFLNLLSHVSVDELKKNPLGHSQ